MRRSDLFSLSQRRSLPAVAGVQARDNPSWVAAQRSEAALGPSAKSAVLGNVQSSGRVSTLIEWPKNVRKRKKRKVERGFRGRGAGGGLRVFYFSGGDAKQSEIALDRSRTPARRHFAAPGLYSHRAPRWVPMQWPSAVGLPDLTTDALDRSRTCNPRFRRPMLYPIELRVRERRDFIAWFSIFGFRFSDRNIQFSVFSVQIASVQFSKLRARPGELRGL
jgi:hypothetical protein